MFYLKGKTRKLLSLALSIVMVIGLLPVGPFAPMEAKADTQAEFYAVFNTAAEKTPGEAGYKPANTLSFYYDANKTSHKKSTEAVYDLPTEAKKEDDWGYDGNRKNVKNVVIDNSVKNYQGLKSTAYMFYDMKKAENISGCEYLIVSNVKNMSYMFYYYARDNETITTVPNVSKWVTSNVTNMSFVFESYGYASEHLIAVPDVSNWNTGNVTDMSYMFKDYARHSKDIEAVPDVSNWNTGNVTNMKYMFNGYNGNQESNPNFNAVPDVSKWNTGNVTDMGSMFSGYGRGEGLTAVPDVSKWDTGKVKNMEYMFSGYGYISTGITAVPDVSKWDTSSVQKINRMFYEYAMNSNGFTAVPDVSKWDTSSVINMSYMFYGYASASKNITAVPDVSNWNTSSVENMESMFKEYAKSSTAKVQALDLSQWNIKKLINAKFMFQTYAAANTTGDPIVYATDWSTQKTGVTADNMFKDSKLKGTITGNWASANTSATGCFTAKPVKYIDASGKEQYIGADSTISKTYTVISSANKPTAWNAGWYVVTGGTEAEPITIQGVTVTGEVHLILADGCNLKVTGSSGNAGICVTGENSLIIYGQSAGTGTLNAIGGNYGAGIGGASSNGSNIIINGGTVTATGGNFGAGIGGGQEGTGSNITINGGNVTANGGKNGGAGIGGGFGKTGSNITLNGGTVTATGGESGGAGIGNGHNATGSSDIFVATTLTVKADGNNPPTTVITNTGTDLASSLAGQRYATVKGIVTVTFDMQGHGTQVEPQTVAAGATVVKPDAPTAAGYAFGGWFKETGCSNAWNFNTDTVAANTTLYAKWTPNTNTSYTVQHYQQNLADSGYTLKDTDNLNGTTGAQTTATAKTYEGFTAQSFSQETILGDGTTNVTINYNRNTYSATFKSDGQTHFTEQEKFGALLTEPSAPSKSGCTFGGWYKEDTFTNAWNFSSDTMPGKDISIYAKWNDKDPAPAAPTGLVVTNPSYEGGSDGKITGVNDTMEYSTDSMNHWTKVTGSEITGLSEGAVYVRVAETASTKAGKETCLAVGKILLFDVTYKNYYGNDTDKVVKVASGSTATRPDPDPTYTRWTFVDWFKQSLKDLFDFTDKILKDTIIYAKWEKEVYTASFDANGGSGSMADIDTVDWKLKLPANEFTAPAGKKFSGWCVGSKMGDAKAAGTEVELIEDTVVYAMWEEIAPPAPTEDCTVRFDFESETTKTRTVKAGTVITLPTISKEGFIFKGWSVTKQQGDFDPTPVASPYTVEEDVLFHALFAEVKKVDGKDIAVATVKNETMDLSGAHTDAKEKAVVEELKANQAVSVASDVFGAVSETGLKRLLDKVSGANELTFGLNISLVEVSGFAAGSTGAKGASYMVYPWALVSKTGEEPLYMNVDNEDLNGSKITFRLAVPSDVTEKYAVMNHISEEGEPVESRYIQIEYTAVEGKAEKFVEVDASRFSYFNLSFTNTLPTYEDDSEGSSSWWKSTDAGWVIKPGTNDWYFVKNNALLKGWYQDSEDGRWYYLDPVTGKMLTGWVQVNGKWYYLNPEQGAQTWVKGTDGKYHYDPNSKARPYGSMYCNETTPDSYKVDKNGAWIEK